MSYFKKTFYFAGLLMLAFQITSCLNMNDDMKLPTREEEMTLLKTYLGNLVTKGYNIDTTDLGVYYVTLDKGEGPKAQMGDTLTVGYAGYFVNGFMFDSSTLNSVDEKWTFVLGNPPMIKGWDDGMKVMNKNSRVQIILPSDLAYGETGSGIIGPYRTLVFVVKIHDLKPKLK